MADNCDAVQSDDLGMSAWLRHAASELLKSGRAPNLEAVSTLADMAVTEAANGDKSTAGNATFAFNTEDSASSSTILGLQAPTGINALTQKAKLDFGQANLVVIYGQNGSGKSSYARILKHATGNRPGKPILSNVFDTTTAERSCGIRLRKADGTEGLHTWTPDSEPHEALRGAHIFDSDVAQQYLQQAMEATYEPRALRFITHLVNIADAVDAELKRRVENQVRRKPVPPAQLATTRLAEWLKNLKVSMTNEQLAQKLAWTDADTARRLSLEDALKQPNPAEQLAKQKKLLATMEQLKRTHDTTASTYSDEAMTAVAGARTAAMVARQAAQDLAKVVFEPPTLPGIGEASWRAMWEAAREYSSKSAYPECSFPHVGTDAQCPLCQQPIAADAAERMYRFEEYVGCQLEVKAKKAEETLKALVSAIPAPPERADWLARYNVIAISEGALDTALAAIDARFKSTGTIASATELSPLGLAPLATAIGLHIANKKTEIQALEAAAAPSQHEALISELNELKTKEWAFSNIAAFEAELKRLAAVRDLEAARKLCGTRKMTEKKAELATVEVEKGYVERFAAELTKLGGGRLKVRPDVKERTKGKVLFHLALVDAKQPAKVADVLSEGEARIVALATFLADLTVANSRSPFVFDDPISSLDQEFEERVVARLVELAQARQVIVLTHRLSFLAAVREAAKKQETSGLVAPDTPKVVCREIALRNVEGLVGLVTETNVLEGKVDKALNALLNERLVRARKELEAGDIGSYQSAVKAICSDFRILVERTVEDHLLDGVVVRFRREVQTKNKLAGLAAIDLTDCILLDRLMTEYSCYEHSQPREIGQRLPELATVHRDVAELKEWLGLIAARRQLPKGAPVPAPKPGAPNMPSPCGPSE